MSFDVVFVHGTGVREPAYSKAFGTISEKLKKRNSNLRLHKCYWGGSCGTTLSAGGNTIPDFDTARAVDYNLSDEEFMLGLWKLLYQNPLTELQTLSELNKLSPNAKEEFVPGQVSASEELDQHIQNFRPSTTLREKLERAGIGEVFDQTYADVVQKPDYRTAINLAQPPFGEYCLAIARALVAQSVIFLQNKYDDPTLSLNNDDLRDEIVAHIAEELDDSSRGIFSGVKNVLFGAIKGIVLNDLQRKRGKVSEKASGGIGDILMYQARGQKIRDYIRTTLTDLPGPIVLIGHSLGGIACVDLFLEKNPPHVDLLVTVGSQAPLLYELNALVGMEYSPNGALPPDFPRWLNIYAKNDLLSYIGGKVFAGVEDEEVKIREPFPESHGAYWAKDEMWDKILQRMV